MGRVSGVVMVLLLEINWLWSPAVPAPIGFFCRRPACQGTWLLLARLHGGESAEALLPRWPSAAVSRLSGRIVQWKPRHTLRSRWQFGP